MFFANLNEIVENPFNGGPVKFSDGPVNFFAVLASVFCHPTKIVENPFNGGPVKFSDGPVKFGVITR